MRMEYDTFPNISPDKEARRYQETMEGLCEDSSENGRGERKVERKGQ